MAAHHASLLHEGRRISTDDPPSPWSTSTFTCYGSLLLGNDRCAKKRKGKLENLADMRMFKGDQNKIPKN